MSNRRFKSLAADDVYGDDNYEDDYGEEEASDAMTDEDREQMRTGTAKVRESLGPTFSSVPTKEIEESLWHYYYDFDKSVTYIKSTIDPLM